jgi:acyl-CoA dehydrogenase family protein 10
MPCLITCSYLLSGPALAAGRLVLRKKPPGRILASAHAVEREYRALAAVSQAGVPVPKPLLLCEDSTVLGTPFYLMAFAQVSDPTLNTCW